MGQLGDGTNAPSNVPVAVVGLSDVKHIATGYDFACAIVSDGTVKCWGSNSAGQLGNGTTSASPVPVMVRNLLRATSITAGFGFACAVVDGGVRCWGNNYYGQLGDGTGTSSNTPVNVAELRGVTTIAALCGRAPVEPPSAEQVSGSVCARLADGTVRCWGANDLGELGNGLSALESRVPVAVANLEHVEAIAGGNRFACAITADGNVKCWGSNIAGQLGRDPKLSQLSSTPDMVAQLNKATQLAAGNSHVCVQVANRKILCWGSNDQGQLGDGTRTSSSIPTPIAW